VELSNRAYYLAMIQSSCEYLLGIYGEIKEEEMSGSAKKDISVENIERIKQRQQ